ncbi:MAG: phage antirepressor KilAC domain-containing protein [bacterium]|nr:phage antirepressor KilAC domain-containing protein [bacterium]
MLELIKVNYENEKPTVSGRELHEALEIKTKYADWFERMCEYGFAENTDFILVSQKRETNNPKNPITTLTDHQLTIQMAKEICMLQRNEKGKQFRQYFIKVEEMWNSPTMIMKRALEFANSERLRLQTELEEKDKRIEEMKPKEIFADSVTASNNCILISELAKILKQNGVEMGARRLFAWLRENGYLIKRQGSEYNLPTQKSMELGLFEIKETSITHSDGHITISKTTKVTGKGQIYFINLFKCQIAVI